LHPRIHDIITRINARDLGVSLISNGGLITPEVARRLADQRVHGVQLTLAGSDATEHDAVCGDGSFGRVVAGIDALSEAGVHVSGSLLVTARSAGQARETLGRFVSLGITGVAFNRFNPSGFAMAAARPLLPSRTQVLGALAAAEEMSVSEGLRFTCTMPIPPCIVDEQQFPSVAFGACSAGTLYGEPAVDPDGMLSLCTLQPHPVGNLLHSGLNALLESAGGRAFREAVPDFCRGCLHAHTCLGGCGAAAEWAFGSCAALDPFVAQHVMADYAERIGRPSAHLLPAPVGRSDP
jgi:radical SAM protein with 4Fe4S-binding SPASM domain